MTFVFLGLDGMDYELCQEFDVNFDDRKDIPVDLKHLDQDMPQVLGEDGEFEDLGWWTFYLWGAMAIGEIETPQMEITHPLPKDLSYPHPLEYFHYDNDPPREMDDYFAWDMFDKVRVVNYPISLPEYCRDTYLVKGDAVGTDYDQVEPHMIVTEINDAIRKGYDAVFVVTRLIDTRCHAATEPVNYNAEDNDHLLEAFTGKNFEDIQELGVDVAEVSEQSTVPEEAENLKQDFTDAILEWVGGVYQEAENIIRAINWEEVDNHVIISDHGFDRLGAGNVRSHGPHAVLSSDFLEYDKMSEFIQSWRKDLAENVEFSKEEFEDVSKEEEVKKKLADLGYDI